MPYKNSEDRRIYWAKWYHEHKKEYDQQYAEYLIENGAKLPEVQLHETR